MESETGSANALSSEVKNWAMLCHVSALVGLLGNGIGFILGPVIVWLVKKETHPFIDEQGKEAVNFQITMMIAALISALLIIVLIGFVLLGAVAIVATIFPIIGGLKASNGEHYKYPFSLRLIK